MQRCNTDKLFRVVAVLVRPVDTHGLPFTRLQCVPPNGTYVTRWPDQDEALLEVVRSIRTTIESLQVATVLHSRLLHLDDLADACRQLEPSIRRPYLTSWHPLPDLPDPALIRTLQGHRVSVTSCAVSPQGDWIVSASSDHTLKVWDSRTGAEHRSLQGHTDTVTACAVSPDGTWLVSASGDETLKIWDAHTGAERRTLHGHTSWVTACAVSPDGTWLVSASSDQTLKIWDVRTGTCLTTLHVDGALSGCAFCPDGEHLVAVGQGGVYFLRVMR